MTDSCEHPEPIDTEDRDSEEFVPIGGWDEPGGTPIEPVEITVEARAHGWRLDHYLTRLFPNHSRAHLQRAIEAGGVQLNGLPTRASRRLRVNDRIHLELPAADESTIVPEDLPLDVLFEDDSLVVINKAAGMIVHPGRGNSRGTLAAAVQFHFNRLSDTAGRHRPGIVHRLDRDTTGVILIAKDNQVHQKLSGQFERREVRKEYRAIVRGVPRLESDLIRTFMTTSPRAREKMVVCPEGGTAREALTFYRTAATFGAFSLLELHPRTGRTHQLRVHLQHLGTPIVADALYTGQPSLTWLDVLLAARRTTSHRPALERELEAAESGSRQDPSADVLIARQALHAFRLTFQHPRSGQEMTIEAPLPDDFQRTLAALQRVAAM
jgi:23S rRNA pseudouridine1911/1915/1917 synthase